MNNLIIIGIGSHSKVVADIAKKNNYNIVKNIKYDSNLANMSTYDLNIIKNNKYSYIIGIGNNLLRKNIVETWDYLNYVNIIDPFTSISSNIKIGKGNLICPGAIIQNNSIIGNHNIINTKTSINHDNILGNYIHLCPNVTLCGNVSISDNTTLFSSVVVSPNIKIGSKCYIGANSFINKNIESDSTYYGSPCKKIR